jgi:hypothetical protein
MAKNSPFWFVFGFAAGLVCVVGAIVVLLVVRPFGAVEIYADDDSGVQVAVWDRTSVAGQADQAALECDLQTLRSQIELYKIQHFDRLPGTREDGSFDGTLFVQQMTRRTDVDGTPAGSGSQAGPFDATLGPYLVQMPANRFVDPSVGTCVTGGPGPAPEDGSSGWWMDTSMGTIFANHRVADPDEADPAADPDPSDGPSVSR